MKTKIKSTLYRFVTMRAPELLENEEVIKSFVLHPESEEATKTSVFLNAVVTIPNGSTRAQVLKNTASTFATANDTNVFKDKTALKEAVGDDFYEYALWLTKNRNTLQLNTILEKNSRMTPVKLTNFDAIEIKLWDNLFYQIITSKSSYVREAILSLLVARFFIKNNGATINELKDIRKIAQARVILPKTLFSPEDNSIAIAARKDLTSKLTVSTKELQKTNDILLIENQKKSTASHTKKFNCC